MTKNILVRAGQNRLIPVIWSGSDTQISYSVRLTGSGAGVTLLLLLFGRSTDSVSVNLNVYHQAPLTTCRVLIKGALTEKSKADITGLVKIDPKATGANAWLAAHLLLLSDSASGRVVPNLEISENEVKAGHATSVGRISQEEMFYLRTRGLSESTAKNLLVQGFFRDLLPEFPKKLVGRAEKLLQHII